ncbi:MAG TPA: hypothetical protein DDZ96_11795 [Porphyromonadaceae bacterium]|jgi:hypothetical protein|nr:hypothetical protein [Porphyromonadaceae bacterium]HBX21157.1 hypothetical protein [Porphyromonadaceae bacterium]HCM20875.1 hypothetical protein [Porphyromonadaceae bacterium]
MGLFGKKFELKKEYFLPYFDIDRDTLCKLRKEQGFKVDTYYDSWAVNVRAKMKDSIWLGSFEIIDKFYLSNRGCDFKFIDIISRTNALDFFNQNFRPLPKTVRFKSSDGLLHDYYISSFYLTDNYILIDKSGYGNPYSWFTFSIITKDEIIRY